MVRDDVVRLFHEAGDSAGWKPGVGNPLVINYLSVFANLVIADFLKRSGQYVTNDAPREAAIAEAVAAEREACAKVAEDSLMDGTGAIARAIRARK